MVFLSMPRWMVKYYFPIEHSNFFFVSCLNNICYHIDVFLQLYREDDLHEEKNRISQAFGAICDQGILKKVLQFALSVSYTACFLLNWWLVL